MRVEKLFPPDVTMVCKLSKDGIITFVNQAYEQITGYSQAELVGNSHEVIQDPKLPKVMQERVWDLINQGQHTYFISRNLTKHNEYFWTLADVHSRVHEGRRTAIFIRRKFLPYELKQEFEKLYDTLYEIETKGAGMETARRYLDGWLEDRNASFGEYIVKKFGGEDKIKAYMTSEVSDEELFKIDVNEMKIDEILKTLKKKKRFFGLW